MEIGKSLGGRVFGEIDYLRDLTRDLMFDMVWNSVYHDINIKNADLEVMVREIRFGSNPFKHLWK